MQQGDNEFESIHNSRYAYPNSINFKSWVQVRLWCWVQVHHACYGREKARCVESQRNGSPRLCERRGVASHGEDEKRRDCRFRFGVGARFVWWCGLEAAQRWTWSEIVPEIDA